MAELALSLAWLADPDVDMIRLLRKYIGWSGAGKQLWDAGKSDASPRLVADAFMLATRTGVDAFDIWRGILIPV